MRHPWQSIQRRTGLWIAAEKYGSLCNAQRRGRAEERKRREEKRSKDERWRWWMPKYLIKASYTAEGAKGLLKDGGSKRREGAEQGLKSAGGKAEDFQFVL